MILTKREMAVEIHEDGRRARSACKLYLTSVDCGTCEPCVRYHMAERLARKIQSGETVISNTIPERQAKHGILCCSEWP